MSVSLTFPDSTYSSSNKPSTATLKTDLQAIETDYNAHLADATIHFLASTLWPVGSVYISVVATNPGTLLGFGTWTAFGAGKVLVGLDSGDTDFDTAEETGGEKTHLLTGAESGTSVHSHATDAQKTYGTKWSTSTTGTPVGTDVSIGFQAATVSNSSAANASSAHNNLQPYIVTYMWKRTA